MHEELRIEYTAVRSEVFARFKMTAESAKKAHMRFLSSLRSPNANQSEYCKCNKLWSTVTSFCWKVETGESTGTVDKKDYALSGKEMEDLEQRVHDWMHRNSSSKTETPIDRNDDVQTCFSESHRQPRLTDISNGLENREQSLSKRKTHFHKHTAGMRCSKTLAGSMKMHEDLVQEDLNLEAFQHGLRVFAAHKTI